MLSRLLNPKSAVRIEKAGDPFDRLYAKWGEHAIRMRQDPPSRERWDAIVLRLILSEDPERVARYRRIQAVGPENLGQDAFELWSKMPSYTPNLHVPAADFVAYEQAHRGHMRLLMEEQGLLERYEAIIEAQSQPRVLTEEEQARVKSAQRSIWIMGCVGMGFIAIMILSVFLIIAIKSVK